MHQQRWFYVAVATVACILQAQGADKYTDENRPYEFGFTIDGEQHRHEKKDENGLILGEFGFITADGVYHVTVYATDENGNFKILSMKNIRVKPYPTAATSKTPEKKGHSLPFPPSQNPPQTQGPVPQKPQITIQAPPPASPAKSCSHCSLPTTTTKRPQLTDLAVVSKDQGSNQFGGQSPGTQYAQGRQNSAGGQPSPPGVPQNYPGGQQSYPGQNENSPLGGGQQYPQAGSDQNYPPLGENYPQPNYPQGQEGAQTNYPQGSGGSQPNYPQGADGLQPNYSLGTDGSQPNYPESRANYPQQGPNYSQQGSSGAQEYPQSVDGVQSPPSGPNAGDRNPKQITDYANGPQGGNGPQGSQGPSKPTLITAQMQIVDKNTDIHHKQPGEKEGLPDGITKNDMLQLLYTFNYTVGFHGHFEEGYTNGAKQGYYYVTGRNGVRTRVDYVADEKGFRPKITQEVLDLLSDDVPKPETEKDAKYGLKGYEFKWLYYPVDSSRR